jgi:RNA 2',3'-cyclic 3'-phosphodiesterase
MDYGEVWKKFVAQRRLEFGGHMDPSWSRGRDFSVSVIVPVEGERFSERLKPPRDALRPFPFVSLHPDRFMHVTVLPLGFLVEEPREEDEISEKDLRSVEEKVGHALSGVAPFAVGFENLNAFPGAAFVEVRDGGGFDRLRETISGACGFRKPSGPAHLTLAYFHTPDGTRAPDELVSAIERYREWPVGELEVAEVEISLLDLRKDYPEPEPLAKVPLGG